jgi:hypothetical protein
MIMYTYVHFFCLQFGPKKMYISYRVGMFFIVLFFISIEREWVDDDIFSGSRFSGWMVILKHNLNILI